MAKIGKKPTDDQLLEGGGGGAGGFSSIKGTKYSTMPSFKSNASLMDDIKKLTKDTSHLKGGAKKSTDLAEERAAVRMVGRAGAGAAAAVAGAKAADSGDKPKKAAVKSDDYKDMSSEVNLDPSNPTGVSGKGMKKGGMTASSRADGCATKGKTKGRFI
jgi:hypothetical protein